MRKNPLRVVENAAVDANLVHRFTLGQIKVDRLAALGMRLSGVEERRGNSKKRRRNWTTIYCEGGFVQIQATLAMHEKRKTARLHAIALVALWIVRAESARKRRF